MPAVRPDISSASEDEKLTIVENHNESSHASLHIKNGDQENLFDFRSQKDAVGSNNGDPYFACKYEV